MTDSQEIFNTIALTQTNHFSLPGLLDLYRRLGSATAVMEHRDNIRDVIPDASQRLIDTLKDMSAYMRRAEQEMEYISRHDIRPLVMNDEDYPERLRQCDDAPLMLFYKGSANLNRTRVISIVGTRRCTAYGRDIIHNFISRLSPLCPETLIMSGLAYGVDICAHRQASANGFDTAAVLAHGLDYLYPSCHRDTAREMIRQGGLITEFLTNTNADKINFVRRNRIVAGMADATIIIESAEKGGSLITAGIARDYNRDVFAFPGAVGSEYSVGCNHLIRDNVAALVCDADDFVNAMGWQNDALITSSRKEGIERLLFPELTQDEQRVVSLLQETNDLQTNILALRTGISIQQISALLFSLEMKGLIRMYAGGTCHLLK